MPALNTGYIPYGHISIDCWVQALLDPAPSCLLWLSLEKKKQLAQREGGLINKQEQTNSSTKPFLLFSNY